MARLGGDITRSIVVVVDLVVVVVSVPVKYDDDAFALWVVLPDEEATRVVEETGTGVSDAWAGIRRRRGSRSSSSLIRGTKGGEGGGEISRSGERISGGLCWMCCWGWLFRACAGG